MSDEATLLARTRTGSQAERRAARDALLGPLHRPLLALCVHLCGPGPDAEDALQETLAALCAGLPRFRGESSVSTWAYRVALRIALRLKAARAVPVPLSDEFPGSDAGPVEAHADARRVLAAMARLPAEQRAVLALFAIQGLRHREIAEVLGVPEGTVWSRLHGARRRLQAELGTR